MTRKRRRRATPHTPSRAELYARLDHPTRLHLARSARRMGWITVLFGVLGVARVLLAAVADRGLRAQYLLGLLIAVLLLLWGVHQLRRARTIAT